MAETRCDPSNVTSILCNPFYGWKTPAGTPVLTVPDLLATVLNDVGGILGLLAIAALVYAGLRMAAANGDKGVIDKSKKILTYAILGLVISIMAYAGVVAIENFLGVQGIKEGSTEVQRVVPYANLKVFVTAMISNALKIVGVVSLLMIIVNGFKYLISRGDKTLVDSAKKGLTWAVAGLALSLFAFAIINAVAKLIS